MIWCCDPSGETNYVGPEWQEFTGQPVQSALGRGWLSMLHPDDQVEVLDIFLGACRRAATFTVQYRLRRGDGDYARVISGAAPSLSPVDDTFTGFLGTVTEVRQVCAELGPRRSLAYLKLPPPVGAMIPQGPIDKLTDHVLLARAAAERAGDKALIASLDVTLSIIFVKLGASRTAH